MAELSEDQIDFIQKKVRELGTMKEVKKLYKFWKEKKCLVDRYAIKYAGEIGFEDKSKRSLKRR